MTQGMDEPQHVLICGGTGRTGRILVRQLLAESDFELTIVVRDTDKAQLLFGEELELAESRLNVVEGDLTDVRSWEHRLRGVSQVVTAVSCGLCTDPLVVLGVRSPPAASPSAVDSAGIADLAAAAKAHEVRRMVAVTTASAGSPWSPAALFLNAYHQMAVKYKWEGEQAIRDSGLEYVILRPYGLGPDEPRLASARGIAASQSGLGAGTASNAPIGTELARQARRRIPREDVARLCHEALRLPAPATHVADAQPMGSSNTASGAARGSASRVTFECWATDEHARPLDWYALQDDPPGRLPEVDHDLALVVSAGGAALLSAGTARGAWRAGGALLRVLSRLRG